MFYWRMILVLFSFHLLLNVKCLGREGVFSELSCNVEAKYFPGRDTIITDGNKLLFANQSINAASLEWYVNDLFVSSALDLDYQPNIGVNKIMLVAINGSCRDSAYSYIIWDGIQPGRYGNIQKQYSPTGSAMEPFCMASDLSKGYLLAGNYYIPSQNDFVTRTTSLFHIDERGCVDWAKSMAEGKEEVIQAIISTSDSGYLISSFPYQSQQDNYPYDLHVFKLDKTGNEEWARSFSNGKQVNNYYSAICETSDGGFVLEIGSFSLAGSTSAVSIIRIDRTGGFIWGRNLGMENDAFYNIGGILVKGNFIYSTGSISQGQPPFDLLRSFFVKMDLATGSLIWSKKNNPAEEILAFTDIHTYKDSLIINSYSKSRLNHFIFFDNNGDPGNSILINNPYGSLNGKGNILVTGENGIYFHQSSGIAGSSHKDIFTYMDSNRQIGWQYDFTTSALNLSGWNQLSFAPDNGVSGIGVSEMPNGFKALTFLKMDALGNGCSSGITALNIEASLVSVVPLDWVTNTTITQDAIDFPVNFMDIPLESRLLCPKYQNGCDLLKLEGPGIQCQAGDTASYKLHVDPFCMDSVKLTYDERNVKLINRTATNLDVVFIKPGNYVIKADKYGCNRVEDSIVVQVGDKNPRINLPIDTTVCAGSVINLDAGSSYINYLWQDGSKAQHIEIRDAGIYWVKLTDVSGCVFVDSVHVGAVKTLPAEFLPRDSIICSGEILEIRPFQSYTSYSWNTGDRTSSIKVKNPGEYILQVVDGFGCSATDTIRIGTRTCPSGLFFSNAFTPNQDGVNDIFKPRIFVRPVFYQLKIFNRWGQLIFESKDPDLGWNGKKGNVEQESGAYVWFCSYQFDGGKKITERGTVALLR